MRLNKNIHVYRGSGIFCFNCADWTEYVRESKYKLVCPVCGDILEIKPTLWDLVQDYRIEQGLSISKLSHLTGVSRSTIYNIENKYVVPKKKTVLKLAEVLEADKDFFLEKLEEIIEANAK